MRGAPVYSGGFDAGARPVPTLRAEPLWVSVLVVAITLAYTTNVVEYATALGQSGKTPLSQLFYLASYAAAGFLLVLSNGLTRIPLLTPLLVAVLAMVPLSLLWTIHFSETAERSIALLGTSLFGAYLGWRFTLGRLVFLLAITFSIAAVLSVVAIFLVPSIGIDSSGQWAGTWRGVHFHKNGLGSASALGCIIIGYAIADSRGRMRYLLIGGFLLSALLLVASRSTTSLLGGLGIGAVALWARHAQKLPHQVPTLTFIGILAFLVIAIEFLGRDALENALGLFGKSADLSSRVPLWNILWTEFIDRRFWLGYGYSAFWIPDSPRVLTIERELYFTPFYSHNGVLETWLNGGLVLVVLVISLFVSLVARSAILMVRWRTVAVSSFPLIFCGFFFLMNFTESTILAMNSTMWMLFVTFSVFLAKWLRMELG